MNGHGTSARRGVTLNGLKDELYSLNMRMLLAMQNHDEQAQNEVKRQIAEVEKAIGGMTSGCGSREKHRR